MTTETKDENNAQALFSKALFSKAPKTFDAYDTVVFVQRLSSGIFVANKSGGMMIIDPEADTKSTAAASIVQATKIEIRRDGSFGWPVLVMEEAAVHADDTPTLWIWDFLMNVYKTQRHPKHPEILETVKVIDHGVWVCDQETLKQCKKWNISAIPPQLGLCVQSYCGNNPINLEPWLVDHKKLSREFPVTAYHIENDRMVLGHAGGISVWHA